ncbi:serine hydrolase-domain-containing protein [Xylariomycetidae sp. FL2044]|nr:serine hydrolase-domain-containing protein [Xylariomycetidae sp. FL2044]
MKGVKSNKPVMIMLHGAGSSGDILGVQTHSIAKELSKSYELVFLDGPDPSAPGPGVLPLFDDMPGYYSWLSTINRDSSVTTRLTEVFKVARYIEKQLDAQKIDPARVETIFGFSQGALVAMTMLGLGLIGQLSWPNLRFCISVGAGATGDETQMRGIEQTVELLAKLLGRDDGKFPGYVVHAMGTKDLWYRDGKRLADMCLQETSTAMDFSDGHVVPREENHISMLLKSVECIDKKSKLAGGVDPRGDLMEMLPELLLEDETTGDELC